MRTKKGNKEILQVIEIAKEYMQEGYEILEAIEKAETELRQAEVESYEK